MPDLSQKRPDPHEERSPDRAKVADNVTTLPLK
jgi:hypothetical protein